MNKRNILFLTLCCLLVTVYIYNVVDAKFNHATAIGNKTNIPNCQVKTQDGFTNELI